MSIAERIPTTHRGQVLTLAAAAAAWVAVYWVNGWLWDTLLYNGFGMDPDARLTGTLHFFVYDTIKIALLLVAIISACDRPQDGTSRTPVLEAGIQRSRSCASISWPIADSISSISALRSLDDSVGRCCRSSLIIACSSGSGARA